MKTLPSLLIDSGAMFSPCGKYRPLLWRIWAHHKPLLTMLMLNPSTADASKDDQTVARQSTRAHLLGMGGLLVVNIFDFRATDPADMKRADKPCSEENDATIVSAVRRSLLSNGMAICAWGTHGTHRGRSAEVVKLLAGMPLHALKVTTGQPWHPLYLSYDLQPFPWPKEKP